MKSLYRPLLTIVILLCIVVWQGVSAQKIWFDEFLHFAIGGYDSTVDAWTAITKSIQGINHGQTGIYMLLDFWLLQLFGANVLALRLPSILSTLWLLYAGKKTIEFLGFSYRWQILAVLTLACQSGLMTHAYQARPYMPLAAATLGILAYYLSPVADRKKLGLVVLAWISIMLGVLMHPYFIVYWASIYFFALTFQICTGKLKPSIQSAIQFTPITLSILGLLVFYALATLTWKKSFIDFSAGSSLYPFQFFNTQQSLRTLLVGSHLEFLSGLSWLLIPFSLGCIGLQVFNALYNKQVLKKYISGLEWPLLLLVIGLALSLLLSYVSYVRGYWVLPRQWVGSVAVVTIAFVWLTAKLSQALSKRSESNFYLSVLFVLTISLLTRHTAVSTSSIGVIGDSITIDGIEQCGVREFECWVDFSRRNIDVWGAVDQRFIRFYQVQDDCWQNTGSISCFVEDKNLKVQ